MNFKYIILIPPNFRTKICRWIYSIPDGDENETKTWYHIYLSMGMEMIFLLWV